MKSLKILCQVIDERTFQLVLHIHWLKVHAVCMHDTLKAKPPLACWFEDIIHQQLNDNAHHWSSMLLDDMCCWGKLQDLTAVGMPGCWRKGSWYSGSHAQNQVVDPSSQLAPLSWSRLQLTSLI